MQLIANDNKTEGLNKKYLHRKVAGAGGSYVYWMFYSFIAPAQLSWGNAWIFIEGSIHMRAISQKVLKISFHVMGSTLHF